jgi:hypothetical protein
MGRKSFKFFKSLIKKKLANHFNYYLGCWWGDKFFILQNDGGGGWFNPHGKHLSTRKKKKTCARTDY